MLNLMTLTLKLQLRLENLLKDAYKILNENLLQLD